MTPADIAIHAAIAEWTRLRSMSTTKGFTSVEELDGDAERAYWTGRAFASRYAVLDANDGEWTSSDEPPPESDRPPLPMVGA